MEWYNFFNKNNDKLKSPDREKVQEPNPESKVNAAIQENKPESVQLLIWVIRGIKIPVRNNEPIQTFGYILQN